MTNDAAMPYAVVAAVAFGALIATRIAPAAVRVALRAQHRRRRR